MMQGHSSQLAALDYTVCLHSEVFVTTQGGNFPHFLTGHRRYLNGGHSKTIKPDKRSLVLSFDNPKIRSQFLLPLTNSRRCILQCASLQMEQVQAKHAGNAPSKWFHRHCSKKTKFICLHIPYTRLYVPTRSWNLNRWYNYKSTTYIHFNTYKDFSCFFILAIVYNSLKFLPKSIVSLISYY